MNILLIIFNKDIENLEIFKDRIKGLGDTFYVFDNMVFVETNSSTKEVYDKISSNEYEQSSILILHIRNEMFGFWGRMNTKLWSWLNEREERTKDGLTDSYVSEIVQLHTQNVDLIQKIDTLISQNENYQKTVEYLYQQIHFLEEQLRKNTSSNLEE